MTYEIHLNEQAFDAEQGYWFTHYDMTEHLIDSYVFMLEIEGDHDEDKLDIIRRFNPVTKIVKIK